MHLERAVRKVVAREVAPLIADVERMRSQLDRAEDALPIVLAATRDRAECRTLRVKLEHLLAELHGVEDRVVGLARERWPQWRP
jgi:hypothetical protein